MNTKRKINPVDWDVYNSLTFIRELEKDWRHRIALRRCDCGTVCEKRLLYVHSWAVKSCWCTKHFNRLKDPESSCRNAAESKARYHIKKRGIDISITKKQAITLMRSPCHYCWWLWSNTYRNKSTQTKEISFNGIDRIDSRWSYSLENCVPCCKMCNRWKNEMTQKEFLDHVNKIYEFQTT